MNGYNSTARAQKQRNAPVFNFDSTVQLPDTVGMEIYKSIHILKRLNLYLLK